MKDKTFVLSNGVMITVSATLMAQDPDWAIKLAHSLKGMWRHANPARKQTPLPEGLEADPETHLVAGQQ